LSSPEVSLAAIHDIFSAFLIDKSVAAAKKDLFYEEQWLWSVRGCHQEQLVNDIDGYWHGLEQNLIIDREYRGFSENYFLTLNSEIKPENLKSHTRKIEPKRKQPKIRRPPLNSKAFENDDFEKTNIIRALSSFISKQMT
jgi:hypothetical protein